MIGPNLAWLCGTNGSMYYFNGANLIYYALDTSSGFAALSMVNILANYWHGYAVGDFGNILRFYNGEWGAVNSPTTNMLWWLAMFSYQLINTPVEADSTAISCCAVGENGTVLLKSELMVGLKDPPPDEKSALLYPNPSRAGVCFVKGHLPEQGIQIRIMDARGSMVLESQIDYPLSPIDIRNLANGVYMVHITKGERNFVEKLIIDQ